MFNPDEIDPPRAVLKPLDLQQMSVEELNDYIADLQREIGLAQAMITKKEAHKNSIEGLFRS